MTEDVEIADTDDLDVVAQQGMLATTSADARNRAQAHAGAIDREGATGTIEMLLTPEAQAEGTVILSGARPGIDGTYRIVGVSHRADRSGGATTTIEIKQPQGEAGKDARAVTGIGGARGTVPIPTPAPR